MSDCSKILIQWHETSRGLSATAELHCYTLHVLPCAFNFYAYVLLHVFTCVTATADVSGCSV